MLNYYSITTWKPQEQRTPLIQPYWFPGLTPPTIIFTPHWKSNTENKPHKGDNLMYLLPSTAYLFRCRRISRGIFHFHFHDDQLWRCHWEEPMPLLMTPMWRRSRDKDRRWVIIKLHWQILLMLAAWSRHSRPWWTAAHLQYFLQQRGLAHLLSLLNRLRSQLHRPLVILELQPSLKVVVSACCCIVSFFCWTMLGKVTTHDLLYCRFHISCDLSFWCAVKKISSCD